MPVSACAHYRLASGNKSHGRDLVLRTTQADDKQTKHATWSLAMNAHTENHAERIDHRTSRSICDAVGERLQEQFRPENGNLSIRLRQLLEELRRRDA